MQPIVTAPTSSWNYTMSECPEQTKCLLLTARGIATIGQVNGGSGGYIAWSPLPKRNKELERERNIR